jgi:hypothetical protein
MLERRELKFKKYCSTDERKNIKTKVYYRIAGA